MFVCMCDAYVLDPDTCMYDAFINFPQSLTLMHVCMIHISMVLDLDSYVCVCMMHISIVLDLDPEACMFV